MSQLEASGDLSEVILSHNLRIDVLLGHNEQVFPLVALTVVETSRCVPGPSCLQQAGRSFICWPEPEMSQVVSLLAFG